MGIPPVLVLAAQLGHVTAWARQIKRSELSGLRVGPWNRLARELGAGRCRYPGNRARGFSGGGQSASPGGMRQNLARPDCAQNAHLTAVHGGRSSRAGETPELDSGEGREEEAPPSQVFHQVPAGGTQWQGWELVPSLPSCTSPPPHSGQGFRILERLKTILGPESGPPREPSPQPPGWSMACRATRRMKGSSRSPGWPAFCPCTSPTPVTCLALTQRSGLLGEGAAGSPEGTPYQKVTQQRF